MIHTVIRQHFDTIASTHTHASGQGHLLEKGLLLLVSADHQTAGRGRQSRPWISPRSEGLMASFGFLIDSRRTDLGNIPQIFTLSASAVLKEYGVTPLLKWPNDLLVDKKKIAGVLTTTHQTDLSETIYMVVSIGLNVSTSAETLQELRRPATSIRIETGKVEELDSVREAILNRFIADLNQFLVHGFSTFLENYKSQMAPLKGDKINFHSNGKTIEGIFHGITDSGTLLLNLHGDTLSEFVSGELELNLES